MLIANTTSFCCMEKQIDREGKFVFLLCSLGGFKCIVAAMYIPPPFNSDPLKKLAQFMALHPGIPVLALGDFNNVVDPRLDRMSTRPGSRGVTPRASPFAT